MRKLVFLFSATFIILTTFQSCNNNASEEAWNTRWLGETNQEISGNIEEQFQGFSRTMRETAYRYSELYWAGMDQNWEYAEYQREHIEEAMELGFVRRPDREASSQQFMSQALPQMGEVIQSGDKEKFLENFTRFTASCNTCHAMEDVAFMTVKIPSERHTVIYY